MQAAVFLGPQKPFEIRDYPVPTPSAGHALVGLVASGVCGTDLHIWEGAIALPAHPIILGHEFLGTVLALGEGEDHDCLGNPVRVGDLVAVNVIAPCGECLLCRTGGDASCLKLGESLTYLRSADEPPHLHGGFAEATVAPTRYLHRLPAGLPAEVAAAFLCAGPTVIRGMRYAGGLVPGERVVVQGSGPVGLFAALMAVEAGCAVTLIGSGSLPRRLELARELGSRLVLDVRATSAAERREAVMAASGGVGADLLIEASGNPEAVAEGLPLLRPRGRYVWAGQYSDRGTVPLPPHLITLNALQVFGSAQFSAQDRADYFDFLLRLPSRWEQIRSTITDRVPVRAANQAFARARAGQALRTIFCPRR